LPQVHDLAFEDLEKIRSDIESGAVRQDSLETLIQLLTKHTDQVRANANAIANANTTQTAAAAAGLSLDFVFGICFWYLFVLLLSAMSRGS